MGRGSVGPLAINGVTVDFAAEALRDRAGRPVELRPQSFAVLRLLAANAGQLVTKDELSSAVWPGLAVTDDSLVQCIHEIRRAIGDKAHVVLRTVPRRGYRLVPVDATAAPPRWRVPVLAAAVAVVLIGAGAWWAGRPRPASAVPLVAVLPFAAVAEDAPSRLLAAGLTEDVVTDLARFSEFEVLASGVTAAYRDTRADPRRIGTELGAGFVVEGSIAREADRVRVTAQLIDAGSGRSIWSERWNPASGDFFVVQAEIAETIANRLGGGVRRCPPRARGRRRPPRCRRA